MAKPIALVTWKSYRLVWSKWSTTIERTNGRDAMGRMRWVEIPQSEWNESHARIFRDFAEALNVRRIRARRRREGR